MTNPVDFDKYSKNYDQLLQEQTSFFTDNDAYFARYKVELARKRINRPVNKLLEYGCGTGRNVSYLQTAFAGAEITGCDISAESLEEAKTLAPSAEFILESERKWSDREFQLIFVAGVFHHIPPNQRDQVMAELYRRLTPGGDLIVFEHNPYNPVTRRIVSNCPYDADAVLLKPKELRARMTTSGFRNLQSGYCLFIPPSFKKLLFLEPKLQFLPLGGQYFVHARK